MFKKHDTLIKVALGEPVYKKLVKAIIKQDAKSVVDIDELASALRIVPKSVMTFLMKICRELKDGEAKESDLPFGENAQMLINKIQEDQYMGYFTEAGKITHKFDLCSIPQLAAHILSHFELYDEEPMNYSESNNKEHEEKSKKEESSQNERLANLEEKIDAIFALVAKDEPIKKSESLKKNKLFRVLKKAGQMPTMPKPPGAGKNVGGNQGITQTGIHEMKTSASDGPNSKPKIDLGAANVKEISNASMKPAGPAAPKQSTAKSELTVKKSEIAGQCRDCGGSMPHCICFQILSKPVLKKNANDTVTLNFKSDWSKEAVVALYNSLQRKK